jgi:hypothetical protein
LNCPKTERFGTRAGRVGAGAETNWREAENLYSAVEPVHENFQPPPRMLLHA